MVVGLSVLPSEHSIGLWYMYRQYRNAALIPWTFSWGTSWGPPLWIHIFANSTVICHFPYFKKGIIWFKDFFKTSGVTWKLFCIQEWVEKKYRDHIGCDYFYLITQEHQPDLVYLSEMYDSTTITNYYLSWNFMVSWEY